MVQFNLVNVYKGFTRWMVLHKNNQKYKGGQRGFRKLYYLEENTATSASNDYGIWDTLWEVHIRYIKSKRNIP